MLTKYRGENYVLVQYFSKALIGKYLMLILAIKYETNIIMLTKYRGENYVWCFSYYSSYR